MAMGSGVWMAVAGVLATAPAQTLPPRAEFEVASVKPAAPKDGPTSRFPQMPQHLREMTRNMRAPGAIPMPDPGRVRLTDWPLLDLIAAAYSVRTSQVSGPEWLSGQGFDIEAKVPDGTPKEQVNEMLRALLEERFALKVHRESRTESGFALLVGKNGPKLKAAAELPKDLSPEERQARLREQAAAMIKRMQENRQNGASHAGSSRSAWWPGITTGQLATNLTRFTERGLTGKYDVEVETSQGTPDEPGETIFDAVEKLGLKLEPRKITVDTVVVDQASKTPTSN